MKLRPVLIWIAVGIVIFVLGVGVYAVHVRSSAQELINSAQSIRSTADAQREIASWRRRSDQSFSENVSPHGGDYSFDTQIENGLLRALHLVPPTAVGVTITMRDGELRSVLVVMFAGRKPSTTSGVWVQEWFVLDAANVFRVNDKDRPWKATVEFSSNAPALQRKNAFSLNTKCFIQMGGCKSAEEILPAVWQLAGSAGNDPSARSYRQSSP